jgi:hypothetical protein
MSLLGAMRRAIVWITLIRHHASLLDVVRS